MSTFHYVKDAIEFVCVKGGIGFRSSVPTLMEKVWEVLDIDRKARYGWNKVNSSFYLTCVQTRCALRKKYEKDFDCRTLESVPGRDMLDENKISFKILAELEEYMDGNYGLLSIVQKFHSIHQLQNAIQHISEYFVNI